VSGKADRLAPSGIRAFSMIFTFADCELDVDRRELRRNGAAAHMEPQVFDVLHYLVRHRDRVVSKDELYQSVWNGRIVSEATLTSRISAARRAIGDTGERQIYLRTIARHGFRFCGEVAERLRSGPSAQQAAASPVEKIITNLPAPTTSFLGRERDTAEIAALLAGTRLLTLTGAGGVGKTRLANQVAGQVAANHPDGVWLVEFAAAGTKPRSVAGSYLLRIRSCLLDTRLVLVDLRAGGPYRLRPLLDLSRDELLQIAR
jgi:DNA-binding winged helix-turn-helix (wHTH) protein